MMSIMTFAFPDSFLRQSEQLSKREWPELGGSRPRAHFQPEREQRIINDRERENVPVQTGNRFSVLVQNPNMGNF